VTRLLVTGRIRTFDAKKPTADAVLVEDGVVVSVGPREEIEAAAGQGEPPQRYEMPPGAVIVPGFVDPHLHLMAMASARLAVDLSACRSIGELLSTVREAASRLPSGTWLRAVGYDDALLVERRHPTSAELDIAVPANPAVLRHSSGHALVGNTAALVAVGAERVHEGLLSASDERLAHIPRQEEATISEAIGSVSRDLASEGVCVVGDTTYNNDLERQAFLTGLSDAGILRQRLVLHPGAVAVEDFVEAGLSFGASAGRWRIGHVKVMADDDDKPAEIKEAIASALKGGFASAVHVVDIAALGVVLEALALSPPPPGTKHRLEHLALCLPEQVHEIAASSCDVVTQPSFLVHRHDRYEAEVPPVERQWLYRLASLLRAGITVAASSDAPIAPCRPLEVVRAATEREPADERVDCSTALSLITRRAAEVALDDGGWIRQGGPADMVALGEDPTTCAIDGIDRVPVLATWREGDLLHSTGAVA
jgi:predicted amidohydrolase YtcJ